MALSSAAVFQAHKLAAAETFDCSKSLAKSCIKVKINGFSANVLIDSGSTDSFIHPNQLELSDLKMFSSNETVSLAASSKQTKIKGFCCADISIGDHEYRDVKLFVFPDLCTDVILGLDWQSRHESVLIKYGGKEKPLKICNLTTLDISPPPLFENLEPNYKPTAVKSRSYSKEDRQFILDEVNRLLSEDIIEPSNSPWRAQVLVTKNSRHKKRLVIDFSQTINKYTNLDAYPLPKTCLIHSTALNIDSH